MYMHSDEFSDSFKNIETRKYFLVPRAAKGGDNDAAY